MEHTQNGNDRGVSPVIGIVLLVAMTVMLAALVATFAMGFIGNTDPNLDEPNANLTITVDSGTVTVTHNGGESIEASRLDVAGDINGSRIQWSEYGTVEEGDSLTVNATVSNPHVVVTWTNTVGQEYVLEERGN